MKPPGDLCAFTYKMNGPDEKLYFSDRVKFLEEEKKKKPRKRVAMKREREGDEEEVVDVAKAFPGSAHQDPAFIPVDDHHSLLLRA